MGKKYNVVYDGDNCIGAKKCMRIHPKLWKKDSEDKAVLLGGKFDPKTRRFELVIEESRLNDYKESALICPASVIDVVDAETGKSVLNINPTRPGDKAEVPV